MHLNTNIFFDIVMLLTTVLYIFHLCFFHVSYSQFNPFTVDGIATLSEVTVAMHVHHLALSCDELTLSVCGMSEETGLSLTFYDVRFFMHQVTISPVYKTHIVFIQVQVGLYNNHKGPL